MIYNEVKKHIIEALNKSGLEYNDSDVTIERPKNEEFGDIATPVAMRIARLNKRAPIIIAEAIVRNIEKDIFKEVTAVKPGFINFKYSEDFLLNMLKNIVQSDESFFKVNYGVGQKVILEFVSANPTGPLHIGHGRGAAYGDTLARIMEFCGFDVFREYYINDAGNQMRILGRSLLIRLLQLKGVDIQLPDDHYQGEYIIDIAKELVEDSRFAGVSEDWLEKDEKIREFSQIAEEKLMGIIRQDLQDFNVVYDNYFSELILHQSGRVKETIEFLKAKGLIEEREGALWFTSTEFGDDKDRVLVRSSGEPTYFAADIAYHRDKFERGFDIAIDVWGQDHHGYVKRLKTAVELLGYQRVFEVILYQLVALKGFKLSTRKGEFVTLKELVDDVGVDAVRFFFVMRSHNSHLDFDVKLAKEKSSENPVYYVQYAHARINSIFKKYGDKVEWDSVDFSLIKEEEFFDLIKEILYFPNLLINTLARYEVHILPHYLINLAAKFHKAYNKHRVITEDRRLTEARLSVIEAVKRVIALGLSLLGVSAPEEM